MENLANESVGGGGVQDRIRFFRKNNMHTPRHHYHQEEKETAGPSRTGTKKNQENEKAGEAKRKGVQDRIKFFSSKIPTTNDNKNNNDTAMNTTSTNKNSSIGTIDCKQEKHQQQSLRTTESCGEETNKNNTTASTIISNNERQRIVDEIDRLLDDDVTKHHYSDNHSAETEIFDIELVDDDQIISVQHEQHETQPQHTEGDEEDKDKDENEDRLHLLRQRIIQKQQQHRKLLPQQPSDAGRGVLGPDGHSMVLVVDSNNSSSPPIPSQIYSLPKPPSIRIFDDDDYDGNPQHDTISDGSITMSYFDEESYRMDERTTTNTTKNMNNTNQVYYDSHHNRYVNANDNDGTNNNTITILGDNSSANNTEPSTDDDNMVADIERGMVKNRQHPTSCFLKKKDNDGHNAASANSTVKKKKRVTMVVDPVKEAKDKAKEEQEQRQEQEHIDSCCRRIIMYGAFGCALFAIIVGGGISLLLHFGLIDVSVFNFNSNSNANADVSSGGNSIGQDGNDPTVIDIQTNSTTTTAAPLPNEEYLLATMIDILTKEFRVNLFDYDDDGAPTNRALHWLIEEMQLFPSRTTSIDDNLAKFGQRFALVTMKYALLSERSSTATDVDTTTTTSSSTLSEESPTVVFDADGIFGQTQGEDECDWLGITCDDYGRVVEVNYSDGGELLNGYIPKEIRLLDRLQVLDLSYNNIGGSIPDELYTIRDLQRLYLYHNRLTGTISTFIGQLTSLKYLHLSHNVLTGTIPSQLGSSSLPLSEIWGSSSNINNEEGPQKPLSYMNLYDNKLTGTIPKRLRLSEMTYFDIGRNFIGGSIPDDIGEDFAQLRYLHLDHNRITNSIPVTIPPMANGRLVSFLADHNRLEGSVPDNWTMFNKLVQYTIHNNYFNVLGPENCRFNVFRGEECVEFKADCDICTCNNMFCAAMCSST